jgi:rod shape-determining protein MreC
MKNQFQANWQAIVIVVVAVGLVLLALGGYLNPAMRSSLSPLIAVQSWLSSRYQAMYEFVTVPRDAASLRARNQELENQLSLLQTQVIQLQQQLQEAQVLYALLDFARTRPQNEYIASAVIGRDPSPFLHYIIIDQGSDNGLRHGMPVVTQQGLVGRIDAVTAKAARVQLISDPGSSINVRLKKNQVEAIVAGSVTGDINAEMISQEVNLQPGELLLTSGLGGGYPSDIVVGQIVSIRKQENDVFQSASVQPSVDFANLKAVLVIANFRPVDTRPLVVTPVP